MIAGCRLALVLAALLPALARAADERLVARLDALVRRERTDGGWTFPDEANGRPAPGTYALSIAERIAEPLGLARWDLIVVRSPGTPAAGLVLLAANRLAPHPAWRDAARRAGDLLLALQLRSGGWFSEMPVVGATPVAWFGAPLIPGTPLDDDVTPGAIRFLLALWQETGDPRYRAAAERGLELAVEAQLPSGAWPLLRRSAVRRALRPTYEDLATLNDGATPLVIETLLDAARVLGRPDLRAAAIRGGDWLLAVQRDGWAAQYDAAGRPAMGRRFEPPAFASWETRHAMDALLALARETGDGRWCPAVARAAAWLERVALRPGCWARFYDPDTGAPLYLARDGTRVATPAEARGSYHWTGDFGIPGLVALLRGTAGPPLRLPGDAGECDAGAPADTLSTDPRVLIAEAGVRLAALAPPSMPCRSAPSP